MANNIVNATNATFHEVVESSPVPVLVDFWAAWCAPCRAVAPVLEKLDEKFAGKVKIVKVNVDEENALAQRFRVMSIPTLILFKNGQVLNQMVGLRSAQDLENMILKAQ